jgi:hypothetical protein
MSNLTLLRGNCVAPFFDVEQFPSEGGCEQFRLDALKPALITYRSHRRSLLRTRHRSSTRQPDMLPTVSSRRIRVLGQLRDLQHRR